MKKLINYFLENQSSSDRAFERKAKLQIIINLISLSMIGLLMPIMLTTGNTVDLVSMSIITTFLAVGLVMMRKGVSYRIVSSSLIVSIMLTVFSGHLLYATMPLIPGVWYLLLIQLSFYLLGARWSIIVLGSALIYSVFVAYLVEQGGIPQMYLDEFAKTDVESATLMTMFMVVIVSFVVQRYSVKSQDLTEIALKEKIAELKIQQDSLEEVNKSISDSLSEKQRIYMVQYRLRKIESLRRKVLEAVNIKQPFEKLTRMVVNITQEFDDTKTGAIFWLNENTFKKGASCGVPEFYLDSIDGVKYVNTFGSCGPAIESKAPFFINDVRNHINYKGIKDVVNQIGIVSSWSYPIFETDKNILGTFVIYGKENRAPNDDEMSFMKEMSSLVTMIIATSKANQAEKEREVAEKSLQFKSDFLAQMSHEIRTPLNGIVGMVDIMYKNTNLDEVQSSYIKTIRESSTDLMHIINDVLDISKLEAGKMQILKSSASLYESLKKTVALYRGKVEEKQIDLELKFDEKINNYHLIDTQRLRQVVNNLVINAIKFTFKGGVKVEALLLNENETNQKIKVSVKDSGIGISVKDQELLFSKYTQLTSTVVRNSDVTVKGTGLGLTISKQLIELMGGELKLNSELGEGSEFYFELELEKSKKQRLIFTDKLKNARKQLGLNILIAEDKLVNQKVVGLMLNSMKCKVDFANNGEECLVKFKENPDFFDLILMDIQMPVMDGVTATQILKRDFDNVPLIIGLSANNMEGDAEKYMSLGLDDYISKPIESDILFEKLNSLVIKQK